MPKYDKADIERRMNGAVESLKGDLAGLRTSAVRDGDTWVINGSKTFITNGYSADLVITAVRTDPAKKARGITLFAVPASGAPGPQRPAAAVRCERGQRLVAQAVEGSRVAIEAAHLDRDVFEQPERRAG